MQAAISTRVDDQAAQRAAILSLLARPQVRRLAAESGLDLARAKSAAAHLDGEELQRLSAPAAMVDAQLSGGDSVVIAGSTLVLILLIILIILVV